MTNQLALFDLPEAPKPTPEIAKIVVPKHLEAEVLAFVKMLKAPAKGVVQSKPFAVTIARSTETKRYLIPAVTITEEQSEMLDREVEKLVAEMDRLRFKGGDRLQVLAGIAERCGIPVEVER